MITEYRIIKPLFFIQQTILSAFDMPGTVLGKGTGRKTDAPHTAYMYEYFEKKNHQDELMKFIFI